MMATKKTYTEPDFEVIRFSSEDIITTSGDPDDNLLIGMDEYGNTYDPRKP